MVSTPVGGPATDLSPTKGGAVKWAMPRWAALLHQVTGVGTAANGQVLDRLADGPRQPSLLNRVERVAGANGREGGPPQDLVDEQVAQSGEARLIHEAGLECG